VPADVIGNTGAAFGREAPLGAQTDRIFGRSATFRYFTWSSRGCLSRPWPAKR